MLQANIQSTPSSNVVKLASGRKTKAKAKQARRPLRQINRQQTITFSSTTPPSPDGEKYRYAMPRSEPPLIGGRAILEAMAMWQEAEFLSALATSRRKIERPGSLRRIG
jgi:hypothetical protein